MSPQGKQPNMKIKSILVFGLLFFMATTFSKVEATASVADPSAILLPEQSLSARARILQKQAITNVLVRYDSPMKANADAFMDVAYVYNLHPYFIPAIAGLESGFGRHIKPNSHIAFGWGGGRIVFENWDSAIMTVGKSMRTKYIDRDIVTISSIARVYAPPSTTWSSKVVFFMTQFEKEEEKLLKLHEAVQAS